MIFMSEKIIDLLLNSRLDATGLCICEEDIEKIATALNEMLGASLSSFKIEEKTNKENPVVAEHRSEEKKIIFYINKYRKDMYRFLNLKNTQKYLVNLSKYEYEILIKALSMMILIHEFDHRTQKIVMDTKDINNPDYLLLELAHGHFDEENVKNVFGSIRKSKMSEENQISAAIFRSVHDLIPYERMANVHSYDQIIDALKLSEGEKSKVISFLKVLYLKRLLSSYTSHDALTFTNNYDETHSPSTYYISQIGGLHYYGEKFQEKLLKLYRDYPLAYRFYAGIRIEQVESRTFKEEIREASANLKR